MNTREKIVTIGRGRDLLAEGQWCVVASRFDFVTAEIARWLHAVADGRRIFALVIEDAAALVPAHARAELVAALRCVDAVSIAPNCSWREVLPHNPQLIVIRDETGDEQRLQNFRERIARRQREALTTP